MIRHVVEKTPTVDTSAYASGDHLGSLMTLEGVGPGGGDGTMLEAVTVVDKDKQDAAIDLLLFDESPTITSDDNETVNISDAELVDKSIGVFSVGSGDYVDLSAGSVAYKASDTPVKPKADAKLYVLPVSGGTPTYTSVSALTFKFHFRHGSV